MRENGEESGEKVCEVGGEGCEKWGWHETCPNF